MKPRRQQRFKISSDPDFAQKVVDVVGRYMNRPDNAIVLSVDEKTLIQTLDLHVILDNGSMHKTAEARA